MGKEKGRGRIRQERREDGALNKPHVFLLSVRFQQQRCGGSCSSSRSGRFETALRKAVSCLVISSRGRSIPVPNNNTTYYLTTAWPLLDPESHPLQTNRHRRQRATDRAAEQTFITSLCHPSIFIAMVYSNSATSPSYQTVSTVSGFILPLPHTPFLGYSSGCSRAGPQVDWSVPHVPSSCSCRGKDSRLYSYLPDLV